MKRFKLVAGKKVFKSIEQVNKEVERKLDRKRKRDKTKVEVELLKFLRTEGREEFRGINSRVNENIRCSPSIQVSRRFLAVSPGYVRDFDLKLFPFKGELREKYTPYTISFSVHYLGKRGGGFKNDVFEIRVWTNIMESFVGTRSNRFFLKVKADLSNWNRVSKFILRKLKIYREELDKKIKAIMAMEKKRELILEELEASKFGDEDYVLYFNIRKNKDLKAEVRKKKSIYEISNIEFPKKTLVSAQDFKKVVKLFKEICVFK